MNAKRSFFAYLKKCFLKTAISSAVFFVFFFPLISHAAPTKGYEALQVVGGGTITLSPGQEKTIMVGFQNIGEKTWFKEEASFISLYTQNPKYRTSVFQTSSWLATDQPARLNEIEVPVGSVGHILLPLKAPSGTGTYKETFQLAAEDTAWIPGGTFTLTIVVTNNVINSKKNTDTSSTTTEETKTNDASGYEAMILLKSAKKIKANAGEAVSFTVGMKNTGTKSWTHRSIQIPTVSVATTSEYKHSSWVDHQTLLAKTDTPVSPGSLDLLSFSFKAPRTEGNHTVRFVLTTDGITVPGGEIDIPVEVTGNAPKIIDEPVTQEVEEGQIIEEPILRVGILTIDEETGFTADVTCETDYKLKDGTGNLMAEMKAGETVSMFYKKMKYWFNRGKGIENTSYYLRVIPNVENAVCTVTNFDKRVTRNAAYPDNQFRNILELRYSEEKDVTWLINELPVEMYLRGLGETSNVSHEEFKKVLITVARTYALYHWERGVEKRNTTQYSTKHEGEYFHMNSYGDDQVYKGYGYEVRNPLIGQAAEDTHGVVVTYDGETAITPYFSRSDGRTRDWSEVWGGSVPWLKSVPVPCDEGKVLWGHGVGMSAQGALCMANQGQSWQEILHYFYQGVELEKKWD